MFIKRNLVTGAMLFSLAACVSGSSGPTAAQVQAISTDVAEVAAVLAADVPAMSKLTGVNAQTMTLSVQAVESAATQIAANGVSASGVQTLATDFNAVLTAAQADPQLPANISADLSAAEVLIAGAAAVYQIVEPVVATPSMSMTFGTASMTNPSEAQMEAARQVLRQRMHQ